MATSAAQVGNAIDEFKPAEVQSHPYNDRVIYPYQPDIYLLFDYLEEGSKGNFGMALSLLKHANGVYKSIYQSQGSGDSYILKPSFYTATSLQGAVLILAEIGAEYSWGIRVFLLEPDLKVTDMGTLDVAVASETEFMDGPVSAVPYTRVVVEEGGGYRFTFIRDVIFDPGGLKDRAVKREEISYSFSDGELKLLMR
ncbi:MAG: hypothetical protein OEZ16_11015 [Chromatiales bacterium]|nr:hypothetical protein [Chromatiales bacterium]